MFHDIPVSPLLNNWMSVLDWVIHLSGLTALARGLITDLGVFDFLNGRLRLTSYHRGTTIEHIQGRTGFKLEISPRVCETPLPTSEELYLLRHEIDPLEIRRLETLSGSERRQLLHTILESERQ